MDLRDSPDSLHEVVGRSAWADQNQSKFRFYCPQCRADRVLPFQPRPNRFQNLVKVFLTAAFITLLTWGWFDWKGIVVFFPLWAVFELVYRARFRAIASCPHCGFDPYLYLNDVDKARQEMEVFWREKFKERGIPFPEEAPPREPEPGQEFSNAAAEAASRTDATQEASPPEGPRSEA